MNRSKSNEHRSSHKRRGPLVKNFCVGLQLLDDEFVKNALLGKIQWQEVFDRDEQLTRRQRSRIKIHSKYEPGYLFKIVDEKRKSKDKKKTKNNSYQDDIDLTVDSDMFGYEMNDDPFACLKTDLNNNSLSYNSNSVQYHRRSLNQEPMLNGRNVDRSPQPDQQIQEEANILDILKNLDTCQFDEVVTSVPIKCLSCSYTTTSIRNLFLHSSYHRNVCDLCKISFKSVYKYFRHLGYHVKEAESICSSKLECKCVNCSSIFKQESQLIDHFNCCYTILEESIFFDEKIVKYKCKICKLVDVSFKSFQDHYIRSHIQIKCSFCNQWFKSFEQLEQHAFHDHRSFANNYKCEFCLQKFTFKTVYENHLQNRHGITTEEDQTKRCYLCDQEFIKIDFDLIIEHFADHCELWIYNCDTCDFRTNSKSSMISHMELSPVDEYVLLGNRMNLNELWLKLLKKIQSAQEDVIIKDQLVEAFASIL